MATNPTVTPTPPPATDQLPHFTASEAPVTRAYRIAFQVWVLSVLLTIVITLVLYLFDKIYFAFTGR
jgi:hypothetical protein